MSGTVEEVLLQNEDLLFSAAGVRCVIGKVRSARFDRCKVQQLQPEKMLAMCHSGADVQYLLLPLPLLLPTHTAANHVTARTNAQH